MGNSDHGTADMRVRGDNGEHRPWHYMYVYSIKSRLIMRVIYVYSKDLAEREHRLPRE